jgi:hypothetical protein
MSNSQLLITITKGGNEQILANHIEHNIYEVIESSLVFPDITYGTLIKTTIEDNQIIYKKIQKKSPYRTHSIILTQDLINSERLQKIKSDIILKGGQWEQIFSGLFLAHLPKKYKYNPIKELEK